MTSQHQWNLHWHARVTMTLRILYPRPQQRLLQVLSLSQVRPPVPSEYLLGVQKSGDSLSNTRSPGPGDAGDDGESGYIFSSGRDCRLRTSSFSPSARFARMTWTLRSYFSLRSTPMLWKGPSCFQHVWVVHAPEMPWHLQTLSTRLRTVWNGKGKGENEERNVCLPTIM